MAARRRRSRRTSGLNLLIAIDKPYGAVTRAVDNAVADALGDDGVGHIGTLDPAVTGVVVVAVGQAKRLIARIEDGKRKSYAATIRFGFETETDDAEGAPTRMAEVDERLRDADYAREVLAGFVGEIRQRPPRYSAIKVNGVRAYDRARAGEQFELPERDVVVHEVLLVDIDDTDGVAWRCMFSVSAGTYVRALARDIGRAAGSAAHLSALCRTASGNVALRDCITLEQVQELGAERIGKAALDPVQVLGLPAYTLTAQELEHVRNGRAFAPAGDVAETGEAQELCVVRDGRLYGVWRMGGGLLRASVNCTQGIEGVRI